MTWKLFFAAYALGAWVAFGVVSSDAAAICNDRARDPLKCQVQTAIPGAVFWPFALSYALFN